MEKQENKKKGWSLKIGIVAVIVIAIGAIWFVKNQSTPVVEPPAEGSNTDFVLEATAIDLEALTAYELPLIIDFGADSCVPCKEMAPVLKTLNADMQEKAIIKFVDVWKNPDAAQDFPVQVIPTQIFITADGKYYEPSPDLGIEFIQYTYRDTGEIAFTAHQGGLTEEQMRAILVDMGVE